MSVRNLDKLFKPRAVALISATPRHGSLGAVLARNLRRGGLKGPLMRVFPHHRSSGRMPVYPDVASLPEVPDLAVIATPPETVPGIIAGLGARGTRAAIVVTGGFGEQGTSGRTPRQATLDAALPYLLRVVGPNCAGIMVPAVGLDASFSHIPPPAGDFAFVSQSAAMITAVLDWAASRRIGFSHVVSLGDMAEFDFGDMLDYLAADPALSPVGCAPAVAVGNEAAGIDHGGATLAISPECPFTEPATMAIPFLKRFTSPILSTVKICDRYPEHLAR